MSTENNFYNVFETIEQLFEELKQNKDPNSFARPDQAIVTHLHLKLLVDFDNKILDGYVVLNVKKVNPHAKLLLLDSVDLMIFGVYQLGNDSKYKEKLSYKLHTPVPEFGSKISVEIGGIKSDEFQIQIDYQTNSTSRALMWVMKEHTNGKKHPFLYSHGQAINMRAMIPCQDTPSVKATYSAEIKAPVVFQVLMSAKIVKEPELSFNGQTRIHYFHQKIPIPSYLIALAVGDLVSRKIGAISHVWADPSLIEAAAWEFAEIDNLLKVAEYYAGKYVWEIYDILILPPSFPYGGMENPCLTFVSPTLLAGDRSLVWVIAHEIAHSWTGNLVTNANFGHFWLNEGFTVFLERKIISVLRGENFLQISALEGIADLKDAINYYGEKSPFTKLLIDVHGINPDDAFSVVPYEKGYTFLYYLEKKLGGEKVFEQFLKSYIDHFKYQSIETEDFKNYLLDYFEKDSKKNKTLKSLNWNSWLHKPGLPPFIPNYDKTLWMSSKELATKWLEKNKIENVTFKEFQQLSSIQQKLFFNLLSDGLNEPSVSFEKKLSIMRNVYRLDKLQNCEVKCAWIILGLDAKYDDIILDAVEFISDYGRMKYILPIYRRLYKWEKTKKLALFTFNANKNKMMKVAIDAIAKDLKPQPIEKK